MNHKGWAFRLKQGVQLLLVVALVSALADWWRSPKVPADAAQMRLPESAQTLAQASQNDTVVLYFWATWCGICRHTSPALEKLHQDGVKVVGIALQSGSDADIGRYLAGHGWHFDTVNDSGTLARQWQVRAVPTVVLVRTGRIVHSTSGIASYYGLKSRIRLADWKDG